MKLKKLLISSAVIASCLGLTACDSKKNTITIAVGDESAEFYRKAVTDFLANNADFDYKVEVIAADTGTAASTFITDPEAAADIITVAHDNIGKLVEQSIVLPFTDQNLISQVEADNPAAFKNVIYHQGKTDSATQLYAVPYISQALVLMYNKTKVTAEQAKTFEGLMEAAKANNSEALAVTGTDGYNFSYSLLSRNVEGNDTSLQLYKDFNKANCYGQGDDMVATTQWAQRFYADENGGHWPSDAGWASDLQANKVIACVGGAWQFKAFKDAVGGSDNAGFTVLPQFTLTADDVKGTSIPAGTKRQAGTFVDCKVLMLNAFAHEEKYDACQQIAAYISSKSIQNESFKECENLPAYAGSAEYIESIKDTIDRSAYEGAKAQLGMADYGIAQPFLASVLNNYYYQKKAPELYVNIINNTNEEFSTTEQIRAGLFRMEHIWQYGKDLDASLIPTTLPVDITKDYTK